MCKRAVESGDHLLHCDIASALWSALFSQFEMVWVMHERVVDLCASWCSSGWTRSVVM
jgi:hypothetical protein